jgi:hypothetical protein
MIHRTRFALAILVVEFALILFSGGGVLAAGPSPAQRCEAAKIQAATRKTSCLGAAEAKQALGVAADPSRCTVAFNLAFARAESKYGVSCPTTGDAAVVELRVDATQAGTAQLLAGEGRFHDNGDGTITDAETGLMWEKKSSDGSLHDQGTPYSWTNSGQAADGPLFTSFLAGLNAGAGFAGHTDWRIPNNAELETLVNYNISGPAAPSTFNSACVAPCSVTTCSCMAAGFYWSSTSLKGNAAYAWGTEFGRGISNYDFKTTGYFARGVRGGF